jgi:hypothetical protein
MRLGPVGPLPAVGKSIIVPWVTIARFDGVNIAEAWEVIDGLGFMQQLGAIPALS